MSISIEEAEKAAQELLDAANTLGLAMNKITEMGRAGWKAVLDESSAWEKLDTFGPEVLVALRSIAMRLDRAALVKY